MGRNPGMQSRNPTPTGHLVGTRLVGLPLERFRQPLVFHIWGTIFEQPPQAFPSSCLWGPRSCLGPRQAALQALSPY